MKSDVESKRFIQSALRDLECINPDTLNQLKKNISRADLHFPLLDLYVKFQEEIESAIDRRVPHFSVVVRANETNARKIEDVVKKYLQACLDQNSLGAWGKVGSSCTPEIKNIKDNLISIEQLCSVSFEKGYDKNSTIEGLLASLQTRLDNISDEELKSVLQSSFSQIKQAFNNEDFPRLLSSIGLARDVLRSLENTE